MRSCERSEDSLDLAAECGDVERLDEEIVDAELDCLLIFCLSRSTMSFLDQPMSASPGLRFGTFVRIIPLSPLSHFSLAAHLSDLRPREIMIKNMIDLDGVPAKRTVRDSRCQGRS